MKKKVYNSPAVQVSEMQLTNVICLSAAFAPGGTEDLGVPEPVGD